MNILQLESELKTLGVPMDYYSINGNLKADTYILNNTYDKWEYFYLDEKGNQQNYTVFETEEQACDYFIDRMKKEMSHPLSVFKY